MNNSITLIAHADDAAYAGSLAELFEFQGISVRRTSPTRARLSANMLGEPGALFQGSECILLVMSEKLEEDIYAVAGYRATLDAAVASAPADVFLVLTDASWIPGFDAAQVFVDLQARNAMPIAQEVLTVRDIQSKAFRQSTQAVPEVVRANPAQLEIHDYLSRLCRISDYAGVMAFCAIIYEEDQSEVTRFLVNRDVMAGLDLVAGPQLDVFAIPDTATIQSSGSGTAEQERTASSRFMQDFLGVHNLQLHYPSLLMLLMEREKFTNTALIPIIIAETSLFPEKFEALVSTIAGGFRRLRKHTGSESSGIWSSLTQTLKEKGYPISEYKTHLAADATIELFSRRIRYM